MAAEFLFALGPEGYVSISEPKKEEKKIVRGFGECYRAGGWGKPQILWICFPFLFIFNGWTISDNFSLYMTFYLTLYSRYIS